MFVKLMHDNQSILSSFSEFLSFVTNSPVAEEALSGSIDVFFLYVRHSTVFQGYLTSSL